jgi:small multidrug resistance pump
VLRRSPELRVDVNAPKACGNVPLLSTQRFSLSYAEGVIMHWIYLTGAIILEVSGTTCMKLSESFTRLVPSILIVVFYGLSLGALTLALKKIDVSVAYAIWSGVGTALIATIGVLWFKEPLTAFKLISLVLIIAGVVGLNLSGGAH